MYVPIVSGGDILPVLDDANSHHNLDLLYHGGPEALDQIDPRFCFMWNEDQQVPDSEEPVVCASDNLAVATFRALVPRTDDRVFGILRTHNPEGGLDFVMPRSVQEEFFAAVGYVSLFDRTGFDRHFPLTPQGRLGVPEYRSTSSIVPECIIKVEYLDLANLLCDPKYGADRLHFLEGNYLRDTLAGQPPENTLGYV
jgi:hypothetical protein